MRVLWKSRGPSKGSKTRLRELSLEGLSQAQRRGLSLQTSARLPGDSPLRCAWDSPLPVRNQKTYLIRSVG